MKKRAIVAESPRPAKASASRLPGPLEGATFVAGAVAASQLPAPGAPEIAFAGRSNAGKSSALNALARQTRLAYASRTPGRTREINFFRLRGGALVADLPGYGYAAVPRALKEAWQEFLWRYVTTRMTLVGLVLVVDARHGLRPADRDLLAAYLPSGRPVLILATKSDKLNLAQRRLAVAGIRDEVRAAFPDRASAATVVGFSAASRQGLDAADETLAQWVGGRDGDDAAPRVARRAAGEARAGGAKKKAPRSRGVTRGLKTPAPVRNRRGHPLREESGRRSPSVRCDRPAFREVPSRRKKDPVP